MNRSMNWPMEGEPGFRETLIQLCRYTTTSILYKQIRDQLEHRSGIMGWQKQVVGTKIKASHSKQQVAGQRNVV